MSHRREGERAGDGHYHAALDWILQHKAGANGWPPADISKVSGWMVTRLVAGVFGRKPNEVAKDLIGRYRQGKES